MTNEEAIRAILFAKRDVLADSDTDKALDMAIEAFKAQMLHSACTDVAQDTISRQDAIDAVDDAIVTVLIPEGTSRSEIIDYTIDATKDYAIKDIRKLPSAEKRTEERTKTHECDLISRQDAIKAIYDLPNCDNGFSDTYDKSCIIGVIDELPSAEPIIRCKDCKWFRKAGCAIDIVDDSDKPTEDDYCSFAERRTDE